MRITFGDRLKHAWNIFKSRDPTEYYSKLVNGGSSYRPDYNRRYNRFSGDKSIVTAIKNRIAVDAAQVDIQHVRVDDNGRYVEKIDSGLNRCLSIEANIDQTGRAFRLDIFLSLLDEGVIAIVPIDTDLDPDETGSFRIDSMRVGKITQWYPQHVSVELYNDRTGLREEVIVPKKIAAIVENPFYAVMNEPNSTFQRLIHKLGLLDSVDEQSSSGKLDLIIQLPYVVKTPMRRQQAEERRKEIEEQLNGTKYGIAYTDGTEKIQQLSRPLENNLLSQIQYLTELAYSQLGMTKEIMNGTADEKAMLNYNNRIIEPLVAAVADAMKRTFLTRTAITQKQSIEYYRDPFALVPVDNIADIADKFTRNEILTSNEIRQIIGMKPSDDPNADVLRNKNLYDTTGPMPGNNTVYEENTVDVEEPMTDSEVQQELSELDDIDSQLDELERLVQSDDEGDILEHYASPYYDPKKRHEYYEKYEKNGILKGRERASLAGLNEEGKAYARYERESIDNDRKVAVEEDKAKMDKTIGESKKIRDTGINRSKKKRDANVTSANNARDERLASEKSNTETAIETSKNARDSNIASVNSQRDTDIESEKTATRREVDSHKTQTQNKIDYLKEYLSGLDKEDKAAVRDRVKNQIALLRAENAQKRAELQENLKSTTASIRAKAKSDSDSYREEHRKTTESERQKLKDTSNEVLAKAKEEVGKANQQHTEQANALRTTHNEVSSKAREEHKAVTAQAKADYQEAYLKELDYIKSLPEYQAETKKSSSSSKELIGYTTSGKAVYKKKK